MVLKNKMVMLEIPAEAAYIDVVRYTLYGIAANIGFSYEAIEDMKVAVSEAVNNAVLHAYPGNDAQKVDVRFEPFAEGMKITVKDYGASFDAGAATSHAQPVTESDIQQVVEGGLGIYLMQALMDEVQVISEEGTEVILTKFLK
ncbi:anti-sigma B factor RsbW [Xylanibacillus composti]|nr:anti-sigma B factor RsbW [Xylanibacillus composti]